MPDTTTTVAELRRLLAEFVAEREWQKYHDPKNLSMAIAIETAELMEHFQWARNEELPELLADSDRRQEIAEEIADIACFLLSLANALNLDLSETIKMKLEKNRAKYPADQFRGNYHKPKSQS